MSLEHQVLKSTTLFSAMSDEVVARFLDDAQVRSVRSGEVIMAECTQIDEIYMVLDGQVMVETALANADQEMQIATLSTGEFIALFTFLEEGKQNVPMTVTAKTDAKLLVWKNTQWQKIGEEKPEVGYRLSLGISKVLYRRLRMLHEMLLANVSWGLD